MILGGLFVGKRGVDVNGTFDVAAQSRRASRDGWNSAFTPISHRKSTVRDSGRGRDR